MPIPSPHKGQSKSDYISSCVAAISDEYKDNKQAVAICESKWRDKAAKAALVVAVADDEYIVDGETFADPHAGDVTKPYPHGTKCPWCGRATVGVNKDREDCWCGMDHHYKVSEALMASADTKSPKEQSIEDRRKTASSPPEDQMPNLGEGGPSSAKNPDNPTVQNIPIDSTYVGEKPDYSQMQWYMGSLYDVEKDPQTGYAKWPLSFQRIEDDVKRPNKPVNPGQLPSTSPSRIPDPDGKTVPPSTQQPVKPV